MQNQPDRTTVEDTLRFLGQQLLTQKFVLRAVVRKRNEAMKAEKKTRLLIKSLENRMMREFDTMKSSDSDQ